MTDARGSVYVTGQAGGRAVIEGGTLTDYGTIKYDRAGTLEWQKTYNGGVHDEDCGKVIALDRAGNVIVTGQSGTGARHRDIVTLKYSP